MTSHDEIQTALRTHALTLSVATTGAVSLSATADGYERASGSFLADGFREGMELSASGFGLAANNGLKVVRAVTATTLEVDGTAAETAGARTLAVGLPSRRAWENEHFDPAEHTGFPWIAEELVGGASSLLSGTIDGWVEERPLYIVEWYVPADTGRGALRRYLDAWARHFRPGSGWTLPGGEVLRVRGDVAPSRGAIYQHRPGFAMQPVTLYLRVHSLNHALT